MKISEIDAIFMNITNEIAEEYMRQCKSSYCANKTFRVIKPLIDDNIGGGKHYVFVCQYFDFDIIRYRHTYPHININRFIDWYRAIQRDSIIDKLLYG